MNKFAKALLLAFVLAAPVAVSVPAVQAKTVTSSTRMHHPKRHRVIHHNVKSMSGTKAVSLKK